MGSRGSERRFPPRMGNIFSSKEAIETIEKGKKIYFDTFGNPQAENIADIWMIA
jgi:hypothetical protein